MTELDERTKEEFAKLMHVIVREEFSDELTPFSVAGERLSSPMN
jgi:hypothetical protein